jgi:hypothetical protein
MPLSYLHDDCHKQAVTHIRESRRFKSMYILQGKPDQHTTRFPRSVRVWSLLPTKKAPDTIHNTLDDRSAGPYPVYLPNQPMKLWGQSQASVDGGYSAYWAHKHQHAIYTFNTCLWGPTYRSLTDAGGGYNLGGADLPDTTPWPSTVSTFHLMAPPGRQFNQVLLTKPKCRSYANHVIFQPLGHLP